MIFNKIVGVDNTGISSDVEKKLRGIAEEVILYKDYPDDSNEIIERIGDAECLLVSWNTPIDEYILKNCPNIKYIGMCCSLIDESSSNVDVSYGKKMGIETRGVRDYGDIGPFEFIIHQLIGIYHGYNNLLKLSEPEELTKKRIGIIGMGATGQLMAKRCLDIGMEVFYYSRSRRTEIDNLGATYLPLNDLLVRTEIVSTHLPRNTIVLGKEEFDIIGTNKILVNTSLGPTFDLESFDKWIENKDNIAIFDGAGMERMSSSYGERENIVCTFRPSGWTRQAKERLSERVYQNIIDYYNIEG